MKIIKYKNCLPHLTREKDETLAHYLAAIQEALLNDSLPPINYTMDDTMPDDADDRNMIIARRMHDWFKEASRMGILHEKKNKELRVALWREQNKY